ncbi:MAG: histone-like protein [Candidatus Heimdallarchaeota archaeon]
MANKKAPKRIIKEETNMLVSEKAVEKATYYTVKFLKQLAKHAKDFATVAKKKTITDEMIEKAYENSNK